MNLEQRIAHFFQRIQQRKREKAYPEVLRKLVKKKDLSKIYGYVLEEEASIRRNLENNRPHRIGKETTGGRLVRTLNFIFDPKTEEVRLILETNNKDLNNHKIQEQELSDPYYDEKTKIAWAIDDPLPQKFSNIVIYSDCAKKLRHYEYGKRNIEKMLLAYPEMEDFVQMPSLGQLFEKESIQGGLNYSHKFSSYSSWSNSKTLFYLFGSNEIIAYNREQVNIISLKLISLVNKFHERGIILQSISLKNILIDQDETGEYHLKFKNLNNAYCNFLPNGEDLLTESDLASPEIAAIMRNTALIKHAYYYNKKVYSYGRRVGEKVEAKPEYALPHKANDCWELGMVLHFLYYLQYPSIQFQNQISALIAGLLHPNREARFTEQEALECLEKERASQKQPLNLSKINEFFKRIQQRLQTQNQMPEELAKLIKQEELRAIYHYIQVMFIHLLEQGKPCRLAKNETRLTSTVNLVFDPLTNDIRLILETKRKNKYGIKREDLKILQGSSKIFKPAWVIDGPIFEKYANAVLYLNDADDFSCAVREASIPTEVIKKNEGKNVYLNAVAIGQIVYKKGINSRNEIYHQKISFSPLGK